MYQCSVKILRTIPVCAEYINMGWICRVLSLNACADGTNMEWMYRKLSVCMCWGYWCGCGYCKGCLFRHVQRASRCVLRGFSLCMCWGYWHEVYVLSIVCVCVCVCVGGSNVGWITWRLSIYNVGWLSWGLSLYACVEGIEVRWVCWVLFL